MSKKLLLADDSVVIQKLVGLSFANEDIEIIATDNGDDAVTRAREIVPDVVLADVVMPGKNGYEVCEAIRQDPALSRIPVLLLTGTFEAFDEDRAESAGANGQITKPFEAQALVARVTEVIEASAAASSDAIDAAEIATSPGDDSDFFDTRTDAASDFAADFAPDDASDAALDESRDLDLAGRDLSEELSGDLAGGFEAGLAGSLDAPLDATDPLTDAGELIDDDSPLSDAASPLVAGPYAPSHARSNDSSRDNFAEASTAYGRRAEDAESDSAAPSNYSGLGMGLAAPPAPSDLPSTREPLSESAYGPRAALGSPAHQEPPPLPESTPPALSETPPALSETPPALSETPPALPEAPPAASASERPDARPGFGSGYASASEVDSALSAASDHAATIQVAENDANAKTSPGYVDAGAGSAGTDFTMYSPSAGIDRDSMTANTPNAPFSTSAPRGPDVADLDEQLAETELAVGDAPDADSLASEPAPLDDSDLLEIGPSNLAGDDLDFSFDVSEQQPVDLVGDPFGRSYASLSDISESQILSDPSSDLPADAASDYDVSSSDLSDEDFSRTVLPPSREAGSSRVPEPQRDTDLISVDEDDAPLVGLFGASIAASTPAFAIPDDAPAPAEEVDENGISRGFAAIESDGREDDRRERDGDGGASEASVSDLSPMMEQRIQETLEKVAWEAFSDLSESIVKQVMERVEKIAWEVVPEMAETLVREEIRQMKGEDE